MNKYDMIATISSQFYIQIYVSEFQDNSFISLQIRSKYRLK